MTVEQIRNQHGTLTTIGIGNMSKERSAKLAQILGGKTYMNFEVIVAPMGGECAVSVQSRYEASQDEILGMLLYVMANELVK
jgi:hypothetical protein